MIRVLTANETQTLAEIAVAWAQSGANVGIVAPGNLDAVSAEVFDLVAENGAVDRIRRARGDRGVDFIDGGSVHLAHSNGYRGHTLDMVLYAHNATDEDVENTIPCVR